MTATSTASETLRDSFSLYVPASRADLIEQCSAIADAVVVKGADGPRQVSALRNVADWNGTVLFDRAGYRRNAGRIDASAWAAAQREARADRILTPGCWMGWGSELERAIECEHARCRDEPDATVLLAIDWRWLTKGVVALRDVLGQLDRHVALVIAHRSDPLAISQAIPGILALTSSLPGLSFVRGDHGLIGAIAFGAAHGSIGLVPSDRHFVPPDASGSAIPNDRSPRVFDLELMDWFTAFNVAAWTTVNFKRPCHLTCCNGLALDRFLDPRQRAVAEHHNMTVVAHLANYVLDMDPRERRRGFARLCSDAVERYGPMGKISMSVTPKPQLVQWAQFA